MSDPTKVGEALQANLKSANTALDTYVESVIDAKVYHALHDASAAAKTALDAFRKEHGEDDDLPPVLGEHYRDGLAQMLRNANPRFE
jgi:hypothetical protein